MDERQENRMRADFARYYTHDREVLLAAQTGADPRPATVLRRRLINTRYTRLPAADERREAWRHLCAVADQWDRQPGEMFELAEDLERHHAAGKSFVSEVHLRNHQQVRHLATTALARTQATPAPQRDPITRSQ